LLEGRQAKGNGIASDKFMAELLHVHEGYNWLGIVQIVGVTTKMTNNSPVTNQQCQFK